MPRRAAKQSPRDAIIGVDAFCKLKNAYDLKVTDILVAPGDVVEAGQLLMTIEYYKIATEITAPVAGRVSHLHVKLDDEVQVGDRLIDLAPL